MIKDIEISEKKEMERMYRLFSGGEIAVETYPVQMVLHHLLEGLLNSRVYALDGKQIWSCEYTGKISLSEYCANHELGSEELRWICGGVLKNLQEVQEFLINGNNLYLEPGQIFLDVSAQRVWNCYVPFYESSVWNSIQELIQYLLGHLDQRDTQAVQMIYGMFRYLIQGGCNLDDLWLLLCEKEQKQIEEKTAAEAAPFDDTPEKKSKENKFKENKSKESKSTENKLAFSIGRWIIVSLSLALAVFLVAYVAMNEWYLSDRNKVLVLSAAGVFGLTGIITWRKWRTGFQKVNPLEEQNDEEQSGENRYDAQRYYEKWKEKFYEDEKTQFYEGEKEQLQEEYSVGENQWIKHTQEGETDILSELPIDETDRITQTRLIRTDTKEEILIRENPSIIGKVPQVAQVLIPAATVSRIHAKLFVEQGAYYLEDLNSKNGTYVNEIRLEPQKPVRLEDGDELVFADIHYLFRL